jgi:hypothetical protein
MNARTLGIIAAFEKLGMSIGEIVRAAAKETGEAGLHKIFEKMAPHEFEALKNYVTSGASGGIRADIWKSQPELAQRLEAALGSFKSTTSPPGTVPHSPFTTEERAQQTRAEQNARWQAAGGPTPGSQAWADMMNNFGRNYRRFNGWSNALNASAFLGPSLGALSGALTGHFRTPWYHPINRRRNTIRDMRIGTLAGAAVPLGMMIPYIRAARRVM